MATTTQLPQQVEPRGPGVEQRGSGAPVEPSENAQQALIPAPQAFEAEALVAPNTLAARLPVELDVAVPIRNFRVRNLLALEPGTLVESQWPHGEDVPLGSGDVHLAWSEFEVIDTQLGVRLTRLV